MEFSGMSNQSTRPREQLAGAHAGMRQRRPGRFSKIEKPKDARRALVRLIPYLTPYKFRLILVFVFVLLYTLLDLIGPYLLGVAIDDYLIPKNLQGLVPIAFSMLAVYLLSSGFQIASERLMAQLSQQALKGIRADLFNHLQSLSLSFYDRNPAGELMSRLTNDIDAINQAVSQNVTSLFASVLSLVGILIAMFILNHWLALSSLLVVPLMFFFTGFVARYTRRGFRVLQRELGNLNSTMEETISGQKVVKAFRRNDAAVETFRKQNNAVYQAGFYANSFAFLLMPLTNVLGNFFVIVVAGMGGWLALQGLATIGVIATFISYGRRFIQPLRQLANMYNSIQAALAGAERVFEIIDTEPELKDDPDTVRWEEVKGEVKFENVNFSYIRNIPVIRNFSLEAKAGQTIALVGPTGAGKTTLINLLSRFYDVNGGSIRIDGTDIRRLKKMELRRRLGVVLQDTFLFSNTVMENIRYGRRNATDEECIKAAKMAEADHFIRLLPHAYQTELAERGSNLSQGQRQLLAIARAILANPSLLILDEATSSVDTRTELRIQQALLRLMQGRTSFVIAHRLSTIRDADNVVVIDKGSIVEQGNHQQLLDRQGFYHKLYMSQFKGQTI
jgi:ATP-binding cassette subfamily B multidrug efflux pump